MYEDYIGPRFRGDTGNRLLNATKLLAWVEMLLP